VEREVGHHGRLIDLKGRVEYFNIKLYLTIERQLKYKYLPLEVISSLMDWRNKIWESISDSGQEKIINHKVKLIRKYYVEDNSINPTPKL
jgi:hypothetical protein